MTVSEGVRVEVRGGVGRLELNRPEKLNAISTSVVEEMIAAAAWFDSQDQVRVVVLSGAGRVFSAGADLDEFRDGFTATPTGESRELAIRQARRGAEMTAAIAGLRAVTIGAVHGTAVGGAVALLAACDVRVMADDATVRIPELAMGVPLAWGAIPRLVQVLGPAVTSDLLLTGRPLKAVEAVARGWALGHHPTAELPAAVDTLAAAIAALPAHGVRVVLDRINAVAAGLPIDDDAVALALAAEDQEAISAGRAYVDAMHRRSAERKAEQ